MRGSAGGGRVELLVGLRPSLRRAVGRCGRAARVAKRSGALAVGQSAGPDQQAVSRAGLPDSRPGPDQPLSLLPPRSIFERITRPAGPARPDSVHVARTLGTSLPHDDDKRGLVPEEY